MTGKIAAIGEKDIIEPLKMVGVDIYPATEKNAKKILLDTIEKGYSIVLIGEDTIGGIEKLFLELSLRPMPSIVPIPGKGKSKGFAYKRLRGLVRKAVGTDILKEDEE